MLSSVSSNYQQNIQAYQAACTAAGVSTDTTTSTSGSAASATSSDTASLFALTSSTTSATAQAGVEGLCSMATAALEAAGVSGDTELSESGQAISDARTSYFKKYFPNMTDEQISTLNKFYDAQYSQYEEQMSSFMTELADSLGISLTDSNGVATASNGNYYGANSGVDGLLADANSMVGMTETGNTSAINQITGESGIDCSTTPWCAAWAMNMLKDHGVLDTSSCSNVNYCPTIRNWAQEQGIWANSGSYTPQAGDAILFDWDQDGTSDHIGIVSGVSNGQVQTIEGNSSDSVATRSYSLGSSSVMGYINCAAQK